MSEPIIVTTRSALMEVVKQAIVEYSHEQASRSRRKMTADDLAARYECSRSTIWRRVRRGELPEPIGKAWQEAQIERWERDRAPHAAPQTLQKAA